MDGWMAYHAALLKCAGVLLLRGRCLELRACLSASPSFAPAPAHAA